MFYLAQHHLTQKTMDYSITPNGRYMKWMSAFAYTSVGALHIGVNDDGYVILQMKMMNNTVDIHLTDPYIENLLTQRRKIWGEGAEADSAYCYCCGGCGSYGGFNNIPRPDIEKSKDLIFNYSRGKREVGNHNFLCQR